MHYFTTEIPVLLINQNASLKKRWLIISNAMPEELLKHS
jgi:hypothetical protein